MICPRCGQKYRGYPALSRYCKAEICSQCGTEEAMMGYLGIPMMPFDNWYDPSATTE